MHLIVVEEIHAPKRWQPQPQCLNGARRCPPEDVGSTSGYENFLAIIKNHIHPEHKEMLDWAGGSFDLEGFSIEAVNQDLDRLHKAGSLEALGRQGIEFKAAAGCLGSVRTVGM